MAASGKRFAQARELGGLGLAHGRLRDSALIERVEPTAARDHDPGSRSLLLTQTQKLLEFGRACFLLEPAAQPFRFDDGRERLVEIAVPWRVHGLVCELMEDEGGKLGVAVAEHRVEYRITQVAEGRIRDRGPDVDIVAPIPQSRRFARRAPLVEVAAVAHATRNGEAPALRLDREFRRGEKVPGRIATPEIGEAPIASVIRKVELRHRKIARARRELKPAPQSVVGFRPSDHLIDRLAPPIHLELARSEMRVIAAGQREARRRGHEPKDRESRGIA